MTPFIALLMTMAAFAVVGYPLLRTRRAEGAPLSTNHRATDDLLAERDAAYAAIKELEFEYHLGNLSREDYEDLRGRYRQRAADVLRRLDVAERESAAAAVKARAAEPSRDGHVAEEIERAVALLRQQLEGEAPSRRGRASRTGKKTGLVCPGCHNHVQPDDRFCGRCGARLPASRTGGPDGRPPTEAGE